MLRLKRGVMRYTALPGIPELNLKNRIESIINDKGRYAYYKLANGSKIKASISKYLSDAEIKTKDKLAISTCRDAKSKEFMFIHRAGIVTVPPPKPIDIDELNNELDSLLSS